MPGNSVVESLFAPMYALNTLEAMNRQIAERALRPESNFDCISSYTQAVNSAGYPVGPIILHSRLYRSTAAITDTEAQKRFLSQVLSTNSDVARSTIIDRWVRNSIQN